MNLPILSFCSVANKITERGPLAALPLLLLLLLFACDDDKKKIDVAPASPSEIASVLGIDGATLASALVDPARPAGDLAADIASFTTVEACMKQRTSSLDPLVGDAVDAIGYDTFLRDACRVLEAAKNKDAKKCELIDASSLRARCRALTAMIAGDADACPLKASNKPELGRDATCVAAALRSPAMCAGAQKRDRPSCEALVGRDAKKCDAIPLDELRSTCVRDATRFHGVLPGSAAIGAVAAAKSTLVLHGEGQPDPAQSTVDLDADVGSGVVVVLDGKRTHVSFGHVDLSATPHAAQPLERTRFALAFATSADKPMEIAEAGLNVPSALQATCVGERCTFTVKLTKLEPKRGGAVELSVDGALGAYRIHADVATFVRDVVDRAAALH